MRRQSVLTLSLALFVGLLVALPGSASASSNSLTCIVAGQNTFSPPSTYQLRATLVCAGTVNGVSDAAAIDWVSAGTYAGDCLGTGTMDGNSGAGTVTSSIAGNTGRTLSLPPYQVDWRLGVGTLTFTSPGSGSGTLYMTPRQPCATTSQVVGQVSFTN